MPGPRSVISPGWPAGTGYVPLTQSVTGWASHLLLPWIVLALLYAAIYARMVRGNLLDPMGEDFIRTARAQGLSEGRVSFRPGPRAGQGWPVYVRGIPGRIGPAPSERGASTRPGIIAGL